MFSTKISVGLYLITKLYLVSGIFRDFLQKTLKDNLYSELENEDAFRLNAPETLPTEPKVFPQLNRRKKKRKSKKQAAPPSGEVTAMAPRISVDLGVADEGNTFFSF